jgi:hypothetical protein
LKPLIDEPVPEALAASVRRMAQDAQDKQAAAQDNVVSFPAKPQPETARPAPRPWLMPIAASLVAAITGVVGFALGRMGVPAVEGSGEIAAVLDREASGRDITLGAEGAVLHVVATFRDELGELCREYQLKQPASSTQTVACRQNGGWTTRLALTTPNVEGYTPASAQETVDAYLASIEAGAPLSAEEERKALSP